MAVSQKLARKKAEKKEKTWGSKIRRLVRNKNYLTMKIVKEGGRNGRAALQKKLKV